ncbi:hypothetical protein P153DRAFT_391406 [Dothidotthia symphoricarpi CBS 119687]|uniref:Uncharacterized protein n=1 Tax=Dothidotthia symphoricarpi CBS 119687 TaxID=1392245 RepID=A0A6A5ZZ27_9PLEO|nr:uncharacterized protein P153DRAFT_391406 [Dothidotthia symphoricarpi CBS 119687]KAF2123571.1 hypothetical protein P153DRAFT_391406 [Dothidotthia symphoricarpi CBS 119687]
MAVFLQEAVLDTFFARLINLAIYHAFFAATKCQINAMNGRFPPIIQQQQQRLFSVCYSLPPTTSSLPSLSITHLRIATHVNRIVSNRDSEASLTHEAPRQQYHAIYIHLPDLLASTPTPTRHFLITCPQSRFRARYTSEPPTLTVKLIYGHTKLLVLLQ